VVVLDVDNVVGQCLTSVTTSGVGMLKSLHNGDEHCLCLCYTLIFLSIFLLARRDPSSVYPQVVRRPPRGILMLRLFSLTLPTIGLLAVLLQCSCISAVYIL